MNIYGNSLKGIGVNNFQFDKIYASRAEMEAAVNKVIIDDQGNQKFQGDGVYANRLVLINYRLYEDLNKAEPSTGEEYSHNQVVGIEFPNYDQNIAMDSIYDEVYHLTVWQKVYLNFPSTGQNNDTDLLIKEKYIMIAKLSATSPEVLVDAVPPYLYYGYGKDQIVTNPTSTYYQSNENSKPEELKVFKTEFQQPKVSNSNDLQVHIDMPSPLELDVNQNINYNKEKMNIQYTIDDLISNVSDNYAAWVPVLDGNKNNYEIENGILRVNDPDQPIPVSKEILNINLPILGDLIGILYDTLFGRGDESTNGIRPYFLTHLDFNQQEGLNELNKIINNKEGIIGILTSIFGENTSLPGATQYFLSADWTAPQPSDDNSRPNIENKPSVIFSQENIDSIISNSDISLEEKKLYNAQYTIDFNAWKLKSIYIDGQS